MHDLPSEPVAGDPSSSWAACDLKLASLRVTFRNIHIVVCLMLVFAIIQILSLERVCDTGMKTADSLEHQGLPYLSQLGALQEHLALFRLYSYEYLFAKESEQAGKAKAVAEIAAETRQQLQTIGESLPDDQGRRLAQNLAAAFDDLNREFSSVQTMVNSDFAGAMTRLDRAVPPRIEQTTAAARALEEYGYHLSKQQANATFGSFGWIKKNAVLFGLANIVIAFGAVLFVQLAARRTRSQLTETMGRLRDSQGLYQSLVEQLPAGVFRKDKAGRYVFVNSWFCRLKGAGAEAFLGRTPGEVAARDSGENPAPDPEASRAAAKAARLSEQHHEQIMRTGQQLEVEEHYSDARKGEKYLQVVKSAIVGAGGEVVGSQGIIQDITQRKQAENELSRVHHQLVDASRAAGMAEVATNILHNVGNVLNSVNVSTTLVLEKIKQSKISNLGRVAALVQEHRDDLAAFLTADPKGRQLPEYLGRLSGHLNDEQAGLIQEMEATRRHIEHIKDIVATQQNYAKVSGVAEKVRLVDLVEDAVRMNSGSLARHEVELHRDYPAQLSDISVEKHKVLQILVNLIRNAKHACEETGRPDKQMTLQVRNGGDRVRITVSDNGVGIPAENLIRIFNHGFTTRKDGHGFGLHSSALAAKELGGTLTVASEGPGHGAAFTLEIPTQPTANS